MEVVVEYVFLNNLCVDFFVLKIAAWLAKTSASSKRIVVAAIFASAASVAYPLITNIYLGIAAKVIIGLAMCYFAFGFKKLKSFLRVFLCIILSTAVVGGLAYVFLITLGVDSLDKQTFSEIPLFVFYVALSLYSFAMFKLLKILSNNKSLQRFRYHIAITCGEHKLEDFAYLDSGNFLIDPITEQPVIIVGYKSFSKLFLKVPLQKVLTKSIKECDIAGSHYISVGTVSLTSNMLVVPADEVCIEGKKTTAMLGLSLSKIRAGFGTDILLNANCVCEVIK